MTRYEELEQYAYDHGIIMSPKTIPDSMAVCAKYRGEQIIMLDKKRCSSAAMQTVALAHEIGHLETDAMNSEYSKFTPMSRNEHKADVWAIEYLLPQWELEAQLIACDGRLWEVAEEFGVTQGLVRKAMSYYKLQNEVEA